MRSRRRLPPRLALAALASALLGGCASVLTDEYGTTPTYQAFGDAVRQARIQQTLNPTAASNRNPVSGIEGTAAVNTINAYGNSFKEPPPTFNVLGIGSATTFNAGH